MIQKMERTNEMPNASCLIVTLLYILKWNEIEITFDLALIILHNKKYVENFFKDGAISLIYLRYQEC